MVQASGPVDSDVGMTRVKLLSSAERATGGDGAKLEHALKGRTVLARQTLGSAIDDCMNSHLIPPPVIASAVSGVTASSKSMYSSVWKRVISVFVARRGRCGLSRHPQVSGTHEYLHCLSSRSIHNALLPLGSLLNFRVFVGRPIVQGTRSFSSSFWGIILVLVAQTVVADKIVGHSNTVRLHRMTQKEVVVSYIV